MRKRVISVVLSMMMLFCLLPAAAAESDAWSVIGNICGTNWDTDFPMTEISENVWQSEALELHKGEMLKVRFGGSWDLNYGLAHDWDGSEPAVYVRDGRNLVLPQDGTYVVTLILGDPTTVTLTDGDGGTVLPETESEQDPLPDTWGVIGSIFGSEWDTDYQMTEIETGVWQAGPWAMEAGWEFKVRANCEWDRNYGSPDSASENDNCIIEADGIYLITFDLNGEPPTVTWEMTDLDPQEPVVIVPHHASDLDRIPLTEETFPDANFRAWIAAQRGWTEEEDGAAYLLGWARESESIDCSGQGIETLSGIEYFPNLRYLYAGERFGENEEGEWVPVSSNMLTSFDPALTPNLKELNVNGNRLTSLDMSGAANLERLDCAGNPITSLTLPEHPVCGWTELREVEPINNGDGTYSFDLSAILNPAVYSFDAVDTSEWGEEKTLDTATGVVTFSYRPGFEQFCVKETFVYDENWKDDLWLSIEFAGGEDPVDPDDPDYPYVSDEGIDPSTAFNGGGEDGTPPDRRPDAPAYDGALDGIPIDAAHFPDANFREWILRTIDHETDTDAETGEETYRLTGEQRWNVTVIDCRGRHIESLAGIEYFPNLEWLYCGRKLTEYVPEYAFWLYASNPITELDLSGNPKLTRLYASYCLLTSIDLSRNPELTHLSLFHNRLTALDLSYNTKIEELSFEVNDIASLTAPEMPDLRVLRCGFTQLAAIDLNGRSALTSVRCHNIDTLETLNINGCTGLDPAECEIHDNYALRELRCRSCGLSELPGNIPNLEILDCGGNTQFTSLNLSDFQELRELYCDSCNLYRLDLSVNRKITVLNCSYNHLKELRVALVPGSTPEYGGDFSAFGQTADCTAGMEPDGGGFTFDMSRLVSAENLDRILSVENAAYDSATGIAAFEAESDTIRYTFNASEDDWIPLEMSVTVTLNVEMPELPEGAIPIDREHFPDDNFRNWILQNLTPYYTEDAFGRQYLTDERENALYFDLTGREIHTIEGLQYFPNAFGLFLGDNDLTEADLSQNRNLAEVHLNNNRLTALDVSGLPILQWLNCSGNLLTELDVSHNANLAVLWCRDNNLNEIRLPNGTVHTYRNVRGEEERMNQLARIECDGNRLASLDLADLPALKELSCENNNLTELNLSGSGDFGLLDCDESVDITLPEGMAFHAQMVVNDGEATYRCTSLTAAIDKITGRDGVTGPDEVQSAQITLLDDQEGPALEFAEDQQKTVVIDLDGHTYTAWSDPTILAYENDVTVINGEIVLRQRPAFRSNSLVLSGQIGVNFFMELPAIGGVDYADSYVTFTIPHGSVTERADFDPNARNAASTYYRFTAYVNAIQMAEPITATFHYVENGEKKTVENTFAIRDYLIRFDNMLEENPDVFDEQTVSLVHALADYGHYVQIFLSEHRDWEIGADYAESDRFYTNAYDIEAVRDAVGAYAISRVNETDGDLEAISYSLLLDSETAIKVYFTPSESYTGAVAATADGTACSVIGTGGRYAVVIPKISAHKLTESHTIAVTTEHGTATVTVSALSYVKGLLDYDTDADSQNAMAAIYAYSEAAQDYIATH